MNAALATQQASARAEACRLLSVLFCDPDRATLLAENVPARLEHTFEALGSASAAAARDLHGALTQADAEALRVDYARLFVGPGRMLAPPYGSVYLEAGGALMGTSTLAAAAAYEAAGLHLDDGQHELPDHVSAELEFLHVLAWREHEALGGGALDTARAAATASRSFVARHLGAWAPAFASRLRAGAQEPFYRAVADVLETFIDEEREQGAT